MHPLRGFLIVFLIKLSKIFKEEIIKDALHFIRMETKSLFKSTILHLFFREFHPCIRGVLFICSSISSIPVYNILNKHVCITFGPHVRPRYPWRYQNSGPTLMPTLALHTLYNIRAANFGIYIPHNALTLWSATSGDFADACRTVCFALFVAPRFGLRKH